MAATDCSSKCHQVLLAHDRAPTVVVYCGQFCFGNLFLLFCVVVGVGVGCCWFGPSPPSAQQPSTGPPSAGPPKISFFFWLFLPLVSLGCFLVELWLLFFLCSFGPYSQRMNKKLVKIERYQTLKTIIRRHIGQTIRTRSVRVRRDRSVGKKNHRGRNVSVEGKSAESYQWRGKEQCSRGDSCGFCHGDHQRGQPAQSSSLAPR